MSLSSLTLSVSIDPEGVFYGFLQGFFMVFSRFSARKECEPFWFLHVFIIFSGKHPKNEGLKEQVPVFPKTVKQFSPFLGYRLEGA